MVSINGDLSNAIKYDIEYAPFKMAHVIIIIINTI
jgi:hypothetical protein